jgi:queuine/archaeosine tRNA-ribosyltransferase
MYEGISPEECLKEQKDMLKEKAMQLDNCKLCRLSYKRKEINRVVTIKMILELIQHTDKRGKHIFQPLGVSIIA